MSTPRLPIAVTGNKTALSETALDEIKQLSGARPWPAALQLLLTWVHIISAITLAAWV